MKIDDINLPDKCILTCHDVNHNGDRYPGHSCGNPDCFNHNADTASISQNYRPDRSCTCPWGTFAGEEGLPATRRLFIIRGLPGVGKTTLAKQLLEAGIVAHITAADDYMVEEIDGVSQYKFDPSKLKTCHQNCQKRVEYLMLHTGESIAVHNTFMERWEFDHYLRLAEKLNYEPVVMTMFTQLSLGKLAERNVHGVPTDKIEKMWMRYQA